ncbi:MAG: hypothetical protein VB078_08135, partial [Clostridiaceae bacterium]|nr:hypothetical protein [Clostridiaceae bacterium]
MSNDMRHSSRSKLSRRILIQYTVSLVSFMAGLFLLFLLAYTIYHLFSFQDHDLIYILAQLYAEYMLFFNGIIIL